MRHENAQVEKLSKADEPLPYSVKVVEMNFLIAERIEF